MRRGFAFLQRHLPTVLVALILLAVMAVLWNFSAPITQWFRSAQSFDAVAFLGEHLLAVTILGGCLLILVLVWLPKWQAARPDLTAKERFEVENDARKTFAEIVGGAALLAGLYFTWANLQVTQENATRDREITREGQVTERFTKAIDQLGAVNDKGEKQLEIRLGGIYALERIARDSERDHWSIMEVLTAYVRENAHRASKEAEPPRGNRLPWKAPPPTQSPSLPKLAADIQAVLTVLGRRTLTYENGEKQYLNEAWS
jgi:hypothetical protein